MAQVLMDQASGLRDAFSRQQCISRVKSYQNRIRKAISNNRISDASMLLTQLEIAQQQLEATYK
ncbi:hypothetical protein ACQKP8_03805 [Photobacterium alginatilyticum]|uniref:Uncharacterized protein n=1 Tax=Photobacterium alginatilyticum TaxID=1775171 RepID=A0ABW9YLG1_9GAMM|nr:hypothetical protein [Photobacterium alginatilyticum]NBI54525.1 hypothetical protein [Photobacterium alginatilyticum]